MISREVFIDMEIKEFYGKSVEDALINAKQELGLTSDEIEYEVVEKGGKGFLGLGSKDSVIKAWKKDLNNTVEKIEEKGEIQGNNEKIKFSDNTQKQEVELKKTEIDPIDVTVFFNKAEKFLKDVAEKMQEEITVTVKEGKEINSIKINLEGPNMGVFIGKRGQTLDSLQYLTSIIVNEDAPSHIRVTIDSEDYRNRRKSTLENLANNMAKKAMRLNRRVALEPMNPYERRIIHTYLQDKEEVDTFSEGVEPYRKVVIIPNK